MLVSCFSDIFKKKLRMQTNNMHCCSKFSSPELPLSLMNYLPYKLR